MAAPEPAPLVLDADLHRLAWADGGGEVPEWFAETDDGEDSASGDARGPDRRRHA